MRQVCTTVYTFDELSDKAKDKARVCIHANNVDGLAK